MHEPAGGSARHLAGHLSTDLNLKERPADVNGGLLSNDVFERLK